MQPGQILVADTGSRHVIKMVGDVRLTLCVSFDKFITSLFKEKTFQPVVFDLTEAEAIDSTTLGLMAKVALFSREHSNTMPVVFSTNPSIDRLLETMGLEDIMEIIHEHPHDEPASQSLSAELDEESARERVLEAHHILMKLSRSNREIFRDVVRTLEGRR